MQKIKLYDLKWQKDYEIELIIPHWTMRGIKERLRIGLVNEGCGLYIAGPGRGGDFHLSYQYLYSGNVPNAKEIMDLLATGHGFKEFRVSTQMLHISSTAVRSAVLRLIRKWNHNHPDLKRSSR